MVSIVSIIFSMGYESFSVWSFSCQKSMQNQRVPSFFLTNMMALHHGELEGRMALPLSISWMCSLTSSINGGPMHGNCSLNSSLLVSLMMCLVASVHPISFLSREKILWYSISSHWALFVSSSGQLSSILRSPFCSKIYIKWACCSGIVNLGSFSLSSSRSNSFISSGDTSALGTKLTVTTHLTCHPPDKHIGWEVPFLRTK